jgi:hypothetical protein
MSWWSDQTDNVQGGILGAIGGGISGLFGYKGAKEQNVASAQQARNQMDFQREMSNTAVQRRMADLKKAGINPILAGSKEASSPAGAMAPQFNKAQAALQNAASAANVAHTIALTNKVRQETKRMELPADISKDAGTIYSDTKDLLRQYGGLQDTEFSARAIASNAMPHNYLLRAAAVLKNFMFPTNKDIAKANYGHQYKLNLNRIYKAAGDKSHLRNRK